MAGTPGLTKAKRLKFQTQKGTIEGVGQVVLRPTGTLVASPDGAFVIKKQLDLQATLNLTGKLNITGDSDLNDNALTGVQGGNVLHSVKKTVLAADLTAASTDESIKIWRASAGDVIYDAQAYITQGFKYGATGTIVNIEVGDWADRNGFRTAINCGSSDATTWVWNSQNHKTGNVGEYMWDASLNRVSKTYTTASNIFLKANASGSFFVSSIDVGQVDVFIHTLQNQ